MARLAIYNGNALVREIDVAQGTVRVGRNDQNDIVLVDPGKAVSRFHAELRIGRGTCTIVDLNSQNGTWVAGRRVPQATLMPGQAAVIGTHRLVYKGEASESETTARLAADVRTASPVIAPTASQAIAPPSSVVAPADGSAAAGMLQAAGADSIAPEDAAPAAAAVRSTAPDEAKAEIAASAPVRELAAVRTLPASSLAVKPRVRVRRALLLLAGSLCLAAAGIAGSVFWWPGPQNPPASAARVVAPAPPQDVLGGPPSETPPTEGTTAAPGASSAALPVAGGGTATATTPAAPPVTAPTGRPVGSGSATVNAKPGAAPTSPRVEPSSASRTTLPPKSGEANSGLLIERARAAVRRGDYPAALGYLQPVMRVDAGNPDVLDLLATVRSQGHDAFRRGQQLDTAGRTAEAVPLYEKAIKLLPADHPNAQAARQRVAEIRAPQ